MLMCGITRENIGYPSKAGLEGALAEGVFGASEVEEADVSDCIRGQIAC